MAAMKSAWCSAEVARPFAPSAGDADDLRVLSFGSALPKARREEEEEGEEGDATERDVAVAAAAAVARESGLWTGRKGEEVESGLSLTGPMESKE